MPVCLLSRVGVFYSTQCKEVEINRVVDIISKLNVYWTVHHCNS
jgi:hypothetical protein